MTVTIRNMNYTDISGVQKIAKVSWNTTYEGIIPLAVQQKFLETAYNDEKMKLRLERSVIYVAEVEEELTGFANFSTVRDGGKVELAAIYLHPDVQGQGIGTALLQRAMTELEGIKEIYINVEKENRIGMNFYKSKGFKIVEEFDDNFDGHILKTVRMVLKVK